jgi:hypothetical protein
MSPQFLSAAWRHWRSAPRHTLNESPKYLHHLLLGGLVDAGLVGLLQL